MALVRASGDRRRLHKRPLPLQHRSRPHEAWQPAEIHLHPPWNHRSKYELTSPPRPYGCLSGDYAASITPSTPPLAQVPPCEHLDGRFTPSLCDGARQQDIHPLVCDKNPSFTLTSSIRVQPKSLRTLPEHTKTIAIAQLEKAFTEYQQQQPCNALAELAMDQDKSKHDAEDRSKSQRLEERFLRLSKVDHSHHICHPPVRKSTPQRSNSEKNPQNIADHTSSSRRHEHKIASNLRKCLSFLNSDYWQRVAKHPWKDVSMEELSTSQLTEFPLAEFLKCYKKERNRCREKRVEQMDKILKDVDAVVAQHLTMLLKTDVKFEPSAGLSVLADVTRILSLGGSQKDHTTSSKTSPSLHQTNLADRQLQLLPQHQGLGSCAAGSHFA